jgi:hypothetical protein
MSFKFTSEIATASEGPEERPSRELGAKAFTTDGRLAIYTQASVSIAANKACLILATGKAALAGEGVAAVSDYAIAAGKYGYVSYVFPVTEIE